jgi:hypothetical protein
MKCKISSYNILIQDQWNPSLGFFMGLAEPTFQLHMALHGVYMCMSLHTCLYFFFLFFLLFSVPLVHPIYVAGYGASMITMALKRSTCWIGDSLCSPSLVL